MPLAGRADFLGSFIEDTQRMKAIAKFPQAIVNGADTHGLPGQDLGDVDQLPFQRISPLCRTRRTVTSLP